MGVWLTRLIENVTMAHLTVSSGRATPTRVKVSHPAERLMNSGLGISEPNASIAALAAYNSISRVSTQKHAFNWSTRALPPKRMEEDMGRTGMTSLPMPSAGIKPILRLCLAVVAKDLEATRNIVLGVNG